MKLTTFNYRPYLTDSVDGATPYIVAVRPHEESVEIEWIYTDGTIGDKCDVHFSTDGGVSWQSIATVGSIVQFVSPQNSETMFFVECDGKQSKIRKARTGFYPGVVVNYLHPDDSTPCRRYIVCTTRCVR